jgi:hypothetical protein
MKKLNLFLLFILVFPAILLLIGCENFVETAEVNDLFKQNDLSLVMKVEKIDRAFTVQKIVDSSNSYSLKIDVSRTYSLRGQADIRPGQKYTLSVTLKNIGASPVFNYSFWKKPKTSLRHYTFKGENGSPPTSLTQQPLPEWTTLKEDFETAEGEDSFMLTLHSGPGTFFIKEIKIERLPH